MYDETEVKMVSHPNNINKPKVQTMALMVNGHILTRLRLIIQSDIWHKISELKLQTYDFNFKLIRGPKLNWIWTRNWKEQEDIWDHNVCPLIPLKCHKIQG